MKSAIEQIRCCQSLQELQVLWSENRRNFSRLPKEDAVQVIKAKDQKKAELQFEKDVDDAIKTLDVAGVRMSSTPEDVRKRTFELEQMMTQQANDGDFTAAGVTLGKWLACWLDNKSG